MSPLARISSLLRELAEAVDDLEREEKPKLKPRRESESASAHQAARKVRERLRQAGYRS